MSARKTASPIKLDEETKRRRQHLSNPATSYLIVYNLLQFVGWATIMVLSIVHLIKKRTHVGLWDVNQLWLKIFQTGALLEVIHSAIKIVPSNPILTFVQIFSRVLCVWGIMHPVKESSEEFLNLIEFLFLLIQLNIKAQLSYGVPLLLFTWTITEMTRYYYYFLNLITKAPRFLTWCRYSFFIALYPMGVTGELLCIFSSLPIYRDSEMYSVRLPNKLNFSFSFYYFLIMIILIYIPGFPKLYFHMLKQRKKILQAEKKTD